MAAPRNKSTAGGELTLSELQADNNKQLKQLQQRQQSLAKRYREEKRISISISPMYAPHFGKTMPIILNGIGVYVPCDGRNYDIPESFAMEARQRISQVDEQLRRNKRLADISSNAEAYAGELDLITPGR